MENGGADGYGTSNDSNLNYILTDLRQNYKAMRSGLSGQDDRRADGRRSRYRTWAERERARSEDGTIYVLVGAQMPAALVECGFMSIAAEASVLSAPQYQDVLAGASATAVLARL